MIRNPTIRQAATLIVAASDSLHPERADYHSDGVNDHVEIQAAIDALSATGGKVMLLEGTFNLNDSVKLGDFDELEGQGYNTKLSCPSCYGIENVDQIGGNEHIGVSNLYLEGLPGTGGCLVRFGIVTDLRLYNIHAKDCPNQVFLLTSCNRVWMEDCVADGAGDNCINVNGGSDIHILRCHAKNAVSGGIELENSPSDVIIDGCIVESNAFYAIDVHDHVGATSDTVNITIVNCLIRDHTLGVYGQEATKAMRRVIIANNIIIPGATDIDGIFVQRVVDCLIEGNQIYNSKIAVNIGGYCSRVTVKSNDIFTCEREGIYASVTDYCVRLIIEGNTIDTCVREGIYAREGGYEFIISNNVVHNIGLYAGIRAYTPAVIIGNTVRLAWSAQLVGIHSEAAKSVVVGNKLMSCWNNFRLGDADQIVRDNVCESYTNLTYLGVLLSDVSSAYDKCSDSFMDIDVPTTNFVATIPGTGAEQDIGPGDGGWTAQPDVKRNLTVSCTAVGVPSGTVTITGTNAKGEVISEEFTIAAGGTAIGNQAFATISNINIPATVPAGDTITVGIGSKLGLSNIIYDVVDVYKVTRTTGGAPAATAGDYSVQGTDITVNATYHTVDMATGAGIVAGDCYAVNYRSSFNLL